MLRIAKYAGFMVVVDQGLNVISRWWDSVVYFWTGQANTPPQATADIQKLESLNLQSIADATLSYHAGFDLAYSLYAAGILSAPAFAYFCFRHRMNKGAGNIFISKDKMQKLFSDSDTVYSSEAIRDTVRSILTNEAEIRKIIDAI
jgi:hypothetical protein